MSEPTPNEPKRFPQVLPLEARRLFSADLAIEFVDLTSGSGVPRYVSTQRGATGRPSFRLSNEGDVAVTKRNTPSRINFVLRPVAGGRDVTVGSAPGSLFVGLVAGASKDVSVPLKLRSGLRAGDYRLVALFSATRIKDIDATDNLTRRTPLVTVARSAVATMAAFAPGSTFSFSNVKVSAGSSASTLIESGAFSSDLNVTGTFNTALRAVGAPAPGVITLARQSDSGNSTAALFFTFDRDFPATLAGRTLTLTPTRTAATDGIAAKINEGFVYFYMT